MGAVIEFPCPLAFEEHGGLVAAPGKFGAVSPSGVLGIGESDLGRIAAVPAIFGEPDFLAGGGLVERWQRGTGHGLILSVALGRDRGGSPATSASGRFPGRS